MQKAVTERRTVYHISDRGTVEAPDEEAVRATPELTGMTGTFVRVKASEMSFRQIRVVPRENSPAPVICRGGFYLCGKIYRRNIYEKLRTQRTQRDVP